jgi:hypothetical protein
MGCSSRQTRLLFFSPIDEMSLLGWLVGWNQTNVL